MNILHDFSKNFQQLMKDMTTTQNPRPPEIYMEDWPTASWDGGEAKGDKGMPIKYVEHETSENRPFLKYEAGQDEVNRLEIERGNAVIKALRNRSQKKAQSNIKLSRMIEEMGQEMRETIREETERRLQAENNLHYTAEDLQRANRIIDFITKQNRF